MPDQKNPNSNCLEGMRCPNCGSYEPFRIDAVTCVTVRDSGAEASGDIEWNETSFCYCLGCDHPGTVADFRENKSEAKTAPAKCELAAGRELATVLAALRYWQREGFMSAGHEMDIATDGGGHKPLNGAEIDALCERLNAN